MTTSNNNSNNGTTDAATTSSTRRARSNSILVEKSAIVGGNAAASLPLAVTGNDLNLANVLNSTGPIVDAVLLKASSTTDEEMAAGTSNDASTGLVVEEIQIDTTPKKQMVQQVLGAPITFLGQYEDEGTVLMIRRDQQSSSLNINQHKLQPPFHDAVVRGDILILKVAHEEEQHPAHQDQGGDDEEKQPDENAVQQSNDDFFLNYTKDEYLKFAARTDIPVLEVVNMNDGEEKVAEEDEMLEDDDEESDDDEEMVEGEDDSDDEDDEGDGTGGFLELLMANVLQRFHEENGRMPDEQELQALRAAISQKLGGNPEE